MALSFVIGLVTGQIEPYEELKSVAELVYVQGTV